MILNLLRHAKARPGSATLADIDRPLDERGRRDLALMAPAVAAGMPDLVLCSAALRTRQTLEEIWPALVAARPGREPQRLIEEDLYLAESAGLLMRLRAVPDEWESVLLVGHNPGISDLAAGLLPPATRERLAGGMPTAGLARFRVGRWSALRPGPATLERWSTPRDPA